MLTATSSPKDKELYDQLLELTRKSFLKDRVLICREDNQYKELPGFYKAADTVIYPSQYEGFGIVSIEAMAMGRPIIGSDAPPINEVIKHGINGLLFNTGDPKALAKAIISVSTDIELRETIIEGGKKSISDLYNLETHSNLILDEYARLLR